MRYGRWIAAALCCAVVACNDEDEAAQTQTAPVTRDAQLVYTLDAASDAARTMAQQASTRATHPETRTYAQTLAADHRGIAAAVTQTASQSGLQPAESGVAEDLIEEARTAAAGMGNLTGLEYDLAFVEGEVRLQQALLAALERDLNALQDAALQQLAMDARPTIAAHVQRGRQILAVLREAQADQQARTAALPAAGPNSTPGATSTPASTGSASTETQNEPQTAPAQPAQRAPATPVLGEPVRTPPDTNGVRGMN